jgi:ADP-ribose pyrophosphatase YjhB (NUDIX family)
MEDRMHPNWLIWARELQAIAQTGLTFTEGVFDRVRYEAIRRLAARIMAEHSDGDYDRIDALFAEQSGCATPKIDVRGAVFRADGSILMVREVADGGRWTLPGGWADVNEPPSVNVVREVSEESGFRVTVRKLAAIYDRDKHGHMPPFPFHIYKLFFICDVVGGVAKTSVETSEVAFFNLENLPSDLSIGRVLPQQIARMFEHAKSPELPTDFD